MSALRDVDDSQISPASSDYYPIRPDLTRLTSLAVGVVVAVTLYVAREILIPIALAVLLSFILAPITRALRRANVGRVPAVALAVLLALSIILSLGGLIGAQMSQLVTEIPTYATTIERKIVDLRAAVAGRLSDSVSQLSQQLRRASQEPAQKGEQATPRGPATQDERGAIAVEVREPEASTLDITGRILTPVVTQLATIGLVFIIAIFILLQQADLRDRIIRLFGLRDQHQTTRALDDAANRLSRYLMTQLGLNTAFGVIIGLGLLVIGLPNPLLWAALAGLCRFVPYIGAIIAGALPVALAAAIDPNWGLAIWTAVLFIACETVMGQFIDPLVYGRSTGLSPLAVVISAMFWAWMWGPVGLVLSVPLTVCLVVLGRHVQPLAFLDVLMGDQPALSPVEGLYQRLLTDHPDEVMDYAEGMLKERSLLSFYDDVAIESLRMASGDAHRGIVSTMQLRRILRVVLDLSKDLGDSMDAVPLARDTASDKDAAEMTSSGPVILCISGREVLDEAASTMLAQALVLNGLEARTATYGMVSREQVAALDVANVVMVSIACLELTGNPSNLRYLIRRIRQRLPDAVIQVGLWPTEDDVPHDERLRNALGADHYAVSLQSAVADCLGTIAAIKMTDKYLQV